VAEKVADLKRLLELFEKDFDTPTSLIEFSDTGCRPFGVLGDEGHNDFLAIHFDEHFHAAKGFGILATAFGAFE
jgi:hypothetical protein